MLFHTKVYSKIFYHYSTKSLISNNNINKASNFLFSFLGFLNVEIPYQNVCKYYCNYQFFGL